MTTGGMGVLCVSWVQNPPKPTTAEQVGCIMLSLGSRELVGRKMHSSLQDGEVCVGRESGGNEEVSHIVCLK